MSTEECGDNAQVTTLTDACNHSQHLYFVARVQSVAAFDFDGTGPLGNDLVNAFHGLSVELVFAHGVEAVGTIEDAAATPCNLGIREAVDFVHKLPLATAGVNEVGVRVAPAGQYHAAAGVYHLVGAGGCRAVVRTVKVGDDAVFGHEPRVVNGVEV